MRIPVAALLDSSKDNLMGLVDISDAWDGEKLSWMV